MSPFTGVLGMVDITPGQPVISSVSPTAGDPDNSLTVTWSDDHDLVLFHKIERAGDSGGSPGSWSTIESKWEGGSPYEDSGRASNTTYWYRITAINLNFISDVSSEVNGTTDYPEITSAPSWASGYPQDDAADDTSILLKLGGPVGDAQEYEVYYNEGSSMSGDPESNGTLLGTYTATQIVNNEVDHDVGTTGTTVYYQARGINPDSNGPFSSEASATTQATLPAAPSGVSLSQTAADTIQVSWTDESDNESTWYIQRRERDPGGSWGSYSALDFISTSDSGGTGGTETYDDSTVLEEKEYQYQVAAHNAGGYSSYTESSNYLCVSTTPSAPSSLSATKDATNPDDDVDLSWTDPGTGTHSETEIYYSETSGFTPPGSGSLVDTVNAGTTTYDHNGIGVGSVSPPGNVSVSVTGDNSLQVSWDPVTDATSYKVYRSTTSGFTPDDGTNLIDTVSSSPYSDTGLDPDETYYYKIKAVVPGPTYYYKLIAINACGDDSSPSGQDGVTLDSGESSASSQASGTTYPEEPKSFSATHDTGACPTIQVDLSWDNGGRSEQKTLEVYNYSTSSWDTVSSSIAAGDTAYNNHQPSANQVSGSDFAQYRIKFNSESSYSTDTVYVLCPE